MINFIDQMINGLQVGSIYALVALGYTMVYGIVKLINFAHGDFIMVGGYFSLMVIPGLMGVGMPTWLCVVVAALGCALVGVITERIAYKPLRSSPRISLLITALGVSTFLQNLFQIIYSANPKPYTPVISKEPIEILGITVNTGTIITIVISVLLMLALNMFVKKTKTGKAMRAVSEDAGAAQLMGINVNNTISITFAIGSALAGIASVLYCSAYPMVKPTMGNMLGLKAFVAAVMGGIGIIPGAMFGGVALGVIESLTKAYISSQLADAVTFGILVLVLIVKPTGLFGKNVGEKV